MDVRHVVFITMLLFEYAYSFLTRLTFNQCSNTAIFYIFWPCILALKFEAEIHLLEKPEAGRQENSLKLQCCKYENYTHFRGDQHAAVRRRKKATYIIRKKFCQALADAKRNFVCPEIKYS